MPDLGAQGITAGLVHPSDWDQSRTRRSRLWAVPTEVAIPFRSAVARFWICVMRAAIATPARAG